jgi:hypothetical protein
LSPAEAAALEKMKAAQADIDARKEEFSRARSALMDMGFTVKLAHRALIAADGNVEAAAAWLLAHPGLLEKEGDVIESNRYDVHAAAPGLQILDKSSIISTRGGVAPEDPTKKAEAYYSAAKKIMELQEQQAEIQRQRAAASGGAAAASDQPSLDEVFATEAASRSYASGERSPRSASPPRRTSPRGAASPALNVSASPMPLPQVTKTQSLEWTQNRLVSGENPLTYYDIQYEKRLGRGGFGDVYLGKQKATGDSVAIKKMQINRKNKLEYLLVETELHAKSAQYPGVVRFLQAFLLRDEMEFWVVMEYIDGGPLNSFTILPEFKEPQACYVTKKVLEALCHIHYCVAGESLVAHANGTARSLAGMCAETGAVRGVTPLQSSTLVTSFTRHDLVPLSASQAIRRRVPRRCVCVTLQDGSELVCTPDHPILGADGTWMSLEARSDMPHVVPSLAVGKRVVRSVLHTVTVEPADEQDARNLTVARLCGVVAMPRAEDDRRAVRADLSAAGMAALAQVASPIVAECVLANGARGAIRELVASFWGTNVGGAPRPKTGRLTTLRYSDTPINRSIARDLERALADHFSVAVRVSQRTRSVTFASAEDAARFAADVGVRYSVEKQAAWGLWLLHRSLGTAEGSSLAPAWSDFLTTVGYAAGRRSVALSIVSITPAADGAAIPVYDLTVPNNPAGDRQASFVANGIVVHNCNRIHRDIKSANILVARQGDVKLTDFGLGAQLTAYEQRRRTMLGTAEFMAPEIIMRSAYSTQVDIWALGMLVHEMADGETPFAGLQPTAVLAKIETEGVPPLKRKKWTHEAKDFVSQCLQFVPERRPAARALTLHPWFKHACTQESFVPLVEKVRQKGEGGCSIM